MRTIWTTCLLLGMLMPLSAKTHVQIAQENADSIVAINILRNDGTTFSGTGFVVTGDGTIATNRHVTEDALFINITFPDGTISDPATLLAQSDQVDLALLKIPAEHLHAVTFTDSDYAQPGQTITVIGNPLRLQNTVSSGLISQVRQKADGVIWHQISAPISPSSSGSPVFDENGHVVSVAFSSYEGENNQNLNFAIPSNYLIELLRTQQILPYVEAPVYEAKKSSVWARIKTHLGKSWQMTKRLFSRKSSQAQ